MSERAGIPEILVIKARISPSSSMQTINAHTKQNKVLSIL